MKKLITIIIAIVIVGFTFSCKKNDSSQSKVLILVKSSFDEASLAKSELTGSSGISKSITYGASTISVDTFLVNIKNIDIELDDDCHDDNCIDDCEDDSCGDDCDDDNCSDDYNDDDKGDNNSGNKIEDDIEFAGPFLIDLLSPKAIDGLPIASVDLPNAAYDEVDFELDRCKLNDPKVIYNRSIFIAGKIDGERMRMWYNGDYEFEIDFPETENHLTLTGDDLKMYLDFHINNMLASLNKVDFSSAADRNNNGIIEIGSDDTDGNSGLAHHIIEALLESCDLDDQFDDD
jgi:hypothetical protein